MKPNHIEIPCESGNYCITLASGMRQDAYFDAHDGYWYHPEKDIIIGHGLIVDEFFIVKIE
jgi:hypothetical protein